jgi:hypothetical protein
MGDESLDKVADRVLSTLKSMGAYGRKRARTQAEVARAAKTDTRTLQQATRVLLDRGEPVVSTCGKPPGVFIAETHPELGAYDRQLDNRIRGLANRIKPLRRIIRQWVAAETIEPGGQRRLFT